jgi:mycofactocin precursor
VPKIITAEGVRMTENDTTAEPAGTEEVLTEELLVEEVSIDGMCGVY